MNFFGLFFICFFLILGFIIFFGALFQGWMLIIGAAALMALVISAYLELHKRIERIEEHLGIAVPKEETMTITERWEKERMEREEE